MDAALAFGRVVLVAIFVVSGIGKLADIPATSAYIASKGLPFAELLAFGAGLSEAGSGLMIVFGYRTRLAAIVLIAFTIAATVLFHDFWNLTDVERINELAHAWKNLAVIGGLVMLAGAGPGRWSVDARPPERVAPARFDFRY